MRRNSFLTVMFALVPGAGEMFLGYMKKGLSSMGMFFAIWGIAVFLNMAVILFALPVVWFYSFFSTLNLHGLIIKGMPLPRDEYVISGFNLNGSFEGVFNKKNNLYIGYVLVFVGVISVLGIAFEPILAVMYRYYPNIANILDSFIYRLPGLLVSVMIVLLGIKLIKVKKGININSSEDENVSMYKGQNVVRIENMENDNEQ